MRNPIEGLIEHGEVPHQGLVAIKIERGPDLFSNLLNGNPLTVKLTVFILEEMHPFL